MSSSSLEVKRDEIASGSNLSSAIRNSYCLKNCVTTFCKPTDLPIVLGSSSSNRQKILQLVEWSYDIMIPDIDEKAFRHEDPLFLPVIIAKAKAAAIFERLSDQSPFILLTADQIVLFDSDVREKPVNEEEAIKFLSSYSNRSVSTISAVVATHYPSGKQSHEVDIATVSFGEISDAIVKKVVTKGEVYTAAGGFIIEDEDLKHLILHIDRTADSVLGMPLQATVNVIRAVI